MALDLMPVSTEAPRCSEFARALAILPPGTGLFLDRVILVSVPLPWPKPALKHELLMPAASLVTGSPVPSRLFAMEPVSDQTEVEIYERSGPTAVHHRWQLPDADADTVTTMLAAVADCPVGLLGELEVAGVAPSGIPTGTALPPTFLICTQGSHDTCCGTSGVALADEIEASRPDYVVRRVSHTGGHRFSPTFLSFPEGRMWAFADLDLVDRIVSDTVSARDISAHSRGWWGAKVGPAQVAECAVRAERAGVGFTEPTVVPVGVIEGQAPSQFEVTSGETVWDVQVTVARTVPSIACESPGGLPAKPGREFAWSIERR